MTLVLDALERVDVPGGAVYRCLRCERVLGPATENYRAHAMSFELPVAEGMPADSSPTDGEFVLRHYCCPGCAVLLEVEMVVRGAEPMSSVELE